MASVWNRHIDNREEAVRIFDDEELARSWLLRASAAIAIENAQLLKPLNESLQQTRRSRSDLEKTFAELKGTPAQLIHAEKISVKGQLAADNAHELKQP